MSWMITAIYPHKIDREKDRKLIKAGGSGFNGCGFCFIGVGERDITWNYKSRKVAMNAASRLRALRLKGVKISVCDMPD